MFIMLITQGVALGYLASLLQGVEDMDRGHLAHVMISAVGVTPMICSRLDVMGCSIQPCESLYHGQGIAGRMPTLFSFATFVP
jgi:hypothetical protein